MFTLAKSRLAWRDQGAGLRDGLRAALLVALLLTACDSGRLLSPSAQTIRDLIAAKALWTAQGITNYEFTLQRSCFCADIQPVRVTVSNGLVVSVRPENSAVALPEAEWISFPSIERMFTIAAQELARPAARVDAEFDSVRGFPHSLYIDQYVNMADDEYGYAVTNVRVR